VNNKTIKKMSKALSVIALLVSANYVQATVIDFTSDQWRSAVGTGNSSATVGDVTVKSFGGSLSFNGYDYTKNKSGDEVGCQLGQASHGLACSGDGLGVGDDEIFHSNFSQHIIVEFAKAVNITGIEFLDLFGDERDGEMAAIKVNASSSSHSERAFGVSPGGYYSVSDRNIAKFTNVESLTFIGNLDGYSDYSLARITTSGASVASVPEIDGSHAALGVCLLAGFIAVFRERRIKR